VGFRALRLHDYISSATFVVWGGLAYSHGLVAVSINMCYAVAAFIAGFLIAARWKQLDFNSEAEFVEARFGKCAAYVSNPMQTEMYLGLGVPCTLLLLLESSLAQESNRCHSIGKVDNTRHL